MAEEQANTNVSATGIEGRVVNVIHSIVNVTATTGDGGGHQNQIGTQSNQARFTEPAAPTWESVERVLTSITPLVPETVNFGTETFVCEARPYFHRFEIKWKGKCTDQKTLTVTVCDGVVSPRTAVQRAAAELIRKMVMQGTYPEPSDANNMPTKT